MSSKRKKMIWIAISVLVGIPVIMYLTGTSTIRVQAEQVIDKDADAVWQVMGEEFAQVDKWCTNFKSSKPGGSAKLAGLDYLHRVTLTERGETIQELDAYDSENYSLSYHISKGAPDIAKRAAAVWSLKSAGDNSTIVTMQFDLETSGFKGRMLSRIISMKLSKSAAEITEELKFYIENGSPHPRKLSSMKED